MIFTIGHRHEREWAPSSVCTLRRHRLCVPLEYRRCRVTPLVLRSLHMQTVLVERRLDRRLRGHRSGGSARAAAARLIHRSARSLASLDSLFARAESRPTCGRNTRRYQFSTAHLVWTKSGSTDSNADSGEVGSALEVCTRWAWSAHRHGSFRAADCAVPASELSCTAEHRVSKCERACRSW
jgi:hypothetical protein